VSMTVVVSIFGACVVSNVVNLGVVEIEAVDGIGVVDSSHMQ
jgi:hypothetical protein